MTMLPQENTPLPFEEPAQMQPPRPPRTLALRTRGRLRAVRIHERVKDDRRDAEPPPAAPQGWAALRAQREAERRRKDRWDLAGLFVVVALAVLAVCQMAKSW